MDTRIRASDAEREEYARRVREAVGEGRLNLDEGDERLAKVYAAAFRDELRPLVADLPHEQRRAELAHRGHRNHGGRWVARRLVFLAAFVGFLVLLWAVSGAQFFWPAIPLTFLAFVLLRHALWRSW